MIVRLAPGSRNAMADALRDCLDAAGDGATLKFYTGPQPSNARSAIDARHALLGTARLSFPCAPNSIDGVLSFGEIAEENAAPANGEAAWVRLSDASGVTVLDVDVSGPGGGGTLEINTVNIVQGGPIRVSSFTIVMPAG